MPENTQTQMNFGDSYNEAYELQRQIMAAEDARKAKKRGGAVEIGNEIENAFAGVIDETRNATEADLKGQHKIIVGTRSMGPEAGKYFAHKLNIEFGLRPGELKETIRELLAEITGIPWVEVSDTDNRMLERIAKELGDNPRLYLHPNEFKTLKDFLATHDIGIGLSKTQTGKPTEEDLNRGAMDLIEMLNTRFIKEESNIDKIK